MQGELEHRTSKARYCRTDRKEFVKQMASIERREAHILSIQDKELLQGAAVEEEVATSPEAHFHVRKSQNFLENIPLFLKWHAGDPAIKVSASSWLLWLECRVMLILSDRIFYPSFTAFYLLRPRRS
jgi:hypothetical protein